MGRKAGSSSSIAIPLSKLVALLKPDQVVKVSKGWLEAVEEANDIDFELEVKDADTGTKAASEASAPADKPDAATEPRPSVEIG